MIEAAKEVQTLILGFGPAAASATASLLRAGHAASAMKVLDTSSERLSAASGMGLAGELLRSTTGPELLEHIEPDVGKAILDLGDDVASIAAVRLVRAALPAAVILVALQRPEGIAECLEAGATEAVCAASLAGLLLAESIDPRISPGRHAH